MKEVSSDARALGIRAEMNSRRCWEAELESGSGNEPKEPTNLERSEEDSGQQDAFSVPASMMEAKTKTRRRWEESSGSPPSVILQFVFDDVHQFVFGIQSEGETRRPQRNFHVHRRGDQTWRGGGGGDV